MTSMSNGQTYQPRTPRRHSEKEWAAAELLVSLQHRTDYPHITALLAELGDRLPLIRQTEGTQG